MPPIFTPAVEMKKVVNPIMIIALKIFISKNANVIPTASASVLVAIASSSITDRTNKLLFSFRVLQYTTSDNIYYVESVPCPAVNSPTPCKS